MFELLVFISPMALLVWLVVAIIKDGRDMNVKPKSCENCPPEKDCMKWNGCSCSCHAPKK